MALYKKEVLVRPNSTADFETAMNFAQNWMMNTFQDKPENKDENGNYINYFFADVFFAPGHALGGQTWRIYTPPCEQKYSMTPDPNTGRIEFMVTNLVQVQAELDAHEQEIAAIHAKDDEQDSRLDALEAQGDEVEAVVI